MGETPDIGSTTAAGTPAEGLAFPCEACGADLEFHIGVQSLKCPYCGFVKTLATDPDDEVEEQDFAAMVARVVEQRDGQRADEVGFREIRCDSCSGSVRFSGTLTSSECAYCGSPLLLDNVHDAEHRVPVDGVLPFLIERETARDNLKRWVRSRWFTPTRFRQRGVRGKFNGIYLPYWTFDSLTATRYTGLRGDHYHVTVGSGKNRRRVRRTRWTPASGSFQRFFDDVLVVASRDLGDKRILALDPWPLGRCSPFAPEMLAGFLARTYDIPIEDGFTRARARIDAELRSDARRRIGGDTQQIHSIQSSYDAITYKHLLLPVWMLAYRFRDRAYRVVVNGATGEVQGDRPYSWIKIALTALGGLVLAGIAAFIAANR